MQRLCLTDIAGPFYDPAKAFRNWSALPYYQLDLATAPFVDQRQLAWGVAQACAYLHTIQAQGYTGIVIDNLAHLAMFEHAPEQIYTNDSPVYVTDGATLSIIHHPPDQALRCMSGLQRLCVQPHATG